MGQGFSQEIPKYVAGLLRGAARCERAVRPPPGGGVQGAAWWVAKLIILTDNIQLSIQ